MDLLLHPNTTKFFNSIIANPVHALIIAGPPGSGKAALARYLAANILGLADSSLASYPYYQVISPSESSIAIENIRDLRKFVRLTTPGISRHIRRVAIIENAQHMTIEAQNALLKILEEPPSDTVIVLTTISIYDLLPTITSRAQHFTLSRFSRDVLIQYFLTRGISKDKVERAFYMSDGNIALMSALLQDDRAHQLSEMIATMKSVLGSPPYNRLLAGNELSKDKNQLVIILTALERISHAMMLQSIETENNNSTRKWLKFLRCIEESNKRLRYNPNPKLLLNDLLLSL